MAVALKTQSFNSSFALSLFCADPANSVTTIVSITYDATNGCHVLYYT